MSYETPQFTEFSLCILQKHNCRGLSAEPPTVPDPAPMAAFRGAPLTHDAAFAILGGWLEAGGAAAAAAAAAGQQQGQQQQEGRQQQPEGRQQGPGGRRYSWLVAAGKNPGERRLCSRRLVGRAVGARRACACRRGDPGSTSPACRHIVPNTKPTARCKPP